MCPGHLDEPAAVTTGALDAVRSSRRSATISAADYSTGRASLIYAAGEVIVREGAHGNSMFLVMRGEAAVTLANTSGEVARLHDGDFFGEMSLLTGEPRTATVTAVTECRLLEIGVEAFRRVALADPAIVEQVTAAVGTRRAEMDQHRAARTTAAVSAESPHTFLARVRDFLRL